MFPITFFLPGFQFGGIGRILCGPFRLSRSRSRYSFALLCSDCLQLCRSCRVCLRPFDQGFSCRLALGSVAFVVLGLPRCGQRCIFRILSHSFFTALLVKTVLFGFLLSADLKLFSGLRIALCPFLQLSNGNPVPVIALVVLLVSFDALGFLLCLILWIRLPLGLLFSAALPSGFTAAFKITFIFRSRFRICFRSFFQVSQLILTFL